MVRLTALEGAFCEVLLELRYLSSEQIHALWFADRDLSSVKRRLRDLRASGYLRSVRRQIDQRALAWRLGGQGFRQLRNLCGDDVAWYQEIKPQFIEHLLDTNRVWITLAGPNPVWADLRFSWLGSHKARFEFVSMDRDRRRTRYVNPDALIQARRAGRRDGPRIFLELDRSTECIKERPGQRTIVGKLKAFRAAFVLPRPGERRSAYAAKFGDRRPPKVVFVLSNDKRGRRAEAIAVTARDIAPELDVTCIQLHDAAALRALLAVPVPVPAEADRDAQPVVENHAAVDEDNWEVLRVAASFYKAAVLELRAARVSAGSFPELAELQREVRQRLEKPPRNNDRLVGALYRRFFRASLEVLEKRRPRGEWSRELLAAEREIRPILKMDSASRRKPGMLQGGRHEHT